MKSKMTHIHCPNCENSSTVKLKGYSKKMLSKCTACDFVFSSRIPSETELTEFYSEYAYGGQIYDSPITKKRYAELLDGFEKYRKTNRLLDDGCGSGFFLSVAIERGWEVYGTEYSEVAVRLCRDKGIKMIQGDLALNSFDENFFDVVTSFEVVEHLIYPKVKIAKIHKFLRNGGLFYCTTPNFNSFSRRLMKEEWSVINYPEHLSYFTSRTLLKLLRTHGFQKNMVLSTGFSLTRLNQSQGKAIITRGESSPDEKLRALTERNKLLVFVKGFVNSILSCLKMGDSLKVWVVKNSN